MGAAAREPNSPARKAEASSRVLMVLMEQLVVGLRSAGVEEGR